MTKHPFRNLLIVVAMALATTAHADPTILTFKHVDTRTDGSEWTTTLRVMKTRETYVDFKLERTKAAPGRYTMPNNKDGNWNVSEPKKLDAALAAFDKVKAEKAAPSKATVFSVTCVQRKVGAERCVRRDNKAPPTTETKALDTLRAAITNDIELSDL